MSVQSPTIPPGLPPSGFPIHRFTVDDYHRMVQAGILTENNAVELLEGIVVAKMPHNPPHDTAIELADDLIRPWLPTGWRIRIQSAITTLDSEPEPDLAVVRGDARTRRARHPGPQDLALAIEVSDSTLARDRLEKGRIYARAGIVCYWIINLVDGCIEVYTNPTGPDPQPHYRQRSDYYPTDQLPLVIDGQELARILVAEFLP